MHKNYLILGLITLILCSCSQDPLNFVNSEPVNVQIKSGVFPDFSYAGYQKNEKPIPLVPEKISIEPGNRNDRIAIQNAIDSVSKLPLVSGFRGAIVLKRGEYFVDNTLTIRTSGVVLRGEGQGENGTVLHSTNQANEWASPKAIWSSLASEMQKFAFIQLIGSSERVRQGNLQNITDNVYIGSNQIPVEDATQFTKGDMIQLTKTTNQTWLDKVQMEQFGWEVDDYQLKHQTTILRVDKTKNVLTVEDPAVDNFLLEEGGGTVETISISGRIEQTGVENLRLIATTDGPTPEHHTWTAVKLSGVTNSWVRNVTAMHFSFSAVQIAGQSDYNTIQDCAMVEPVSEDIAPRRYHFYISSGKGNLFQRLYSEEGRHDFVTSQKVDGPNVFLDGLAVRSSNEIGPHHRWASGLLFDNISGGRLEAKNNGPTGTGHGWTGVQTLFWNSHASQSFYVENPSNAINWCIGCSGSDLDGNGYWASRGQPVSPRSLFIYQLDQRLGHGKTDQIISPLQRGNKNIWKELEEWAGSGDALVKTPK